MSSSDKPAQRRENWLIGFWRVVISPSKSLSILVLVLGGLVVGAVGVAATTVSLHLTSTNAFCTSCHTMADNAAIELQKSPHYANPVGFTAGCTDCHEPREFVPQMIRKMQAVDEIWNELLGTISTPAKYEAHRQELAEKEWNRLRADNSQECRSCHLPSAMVDDANPTFRDMHKSALAGGQTCIDCHQGVAHSLPTPTAAK